MHQVIITVETREQAETIVSVLALAEMNEAELDFPFNTEVKPVADYWQVIPPIKA